MDNLIFVTGNKNKAKEAQEILKVPVSAFELELNEIQHLDVEVVVRQKALDAYNIIQQPLIVDDAGVYVDAWKGFPGAFVKYIDQTCGLEVINKWLENEENKCVTVVAAVGYHDGVNVHTFRGEIKGNFVRPRGNLGWGFDPFFLPEGFDKTWGETGPEQKNEVSHRCNALKRFKTFLSNQDHKGV